MAGEFQPVLTAADSSAAPAPTTGSPLVAGLQTLVNAATGIAGSVSAQRKEDKLNKGLSILLNPAPAVDPSALTADHPEIKRIIKASKADAQGRSTSRATAQFGLGVKKLIEQDFTELEIAQILQAKGIKDPRISSLLEQDALEKQQEAAQTAMKTQAVNGAGVAFMYDADGILASVSGKPIDINTSFDKVQKAAVAMQDAQKLATESTDKMVNTFFDGSNKDSLFNVITDSLNAVADKLVSEVNREDPNGAFTGKMPDTQQVIALQSKGSEMVADFQERIGQITAQIPDKKKRDNFIARAAALLDPYKQQFGSKDKSILDSVNTQQTAITGLMKLGFSIDHPIFDKIKNMPPEMQKLIFSSASFANLEGLSDKTLLASISAGISALTGVSSDNNFTASQVDKRVLNEEHVTQEQAVASARLFNDVLRPQNKTRQKLDAENKAMAAPLSGDGKGNSMVEVMVSKSLDPEATKAYTTDDFKSLHTTLLSNPRIANVTDELAKQDPVAAALVGRSIGNRTGKTAILTAQDISKKDGFLERWLIKVDSASQRFVLQTDKRKDAARLTPFLGLEDKDKATFASVRKGIEVLNSEVDTMMRYSKYDARVKDIPEADLRKFYQEALLTVASSKEIGVQADLIEMFPNQPGAKKPQPDTAVLKQTPQVPATQQSATLPSLAEVFDNTVSGGNGPRSAKPAAPLSQIAPELRLQVAEVFDNTVSSDIATLNKAPVTADTKEGRSPVKTVDQLSSAAPVFIKEAAFEDKVAPRIARALSRPGSLDLASRLATVTAGKPRFKNLHNVAIKALEDFGIAFTVDERAIADLQRYKDSIKNSRKAEGLFHQRILELANKVELKDKPNNSGVK